MRARTPHLVLAAALAAAVSASLTLSPAVGTASAAAAPGTPRGVDVDIRSGGDPAYAVSWSAPATGDPTSYEVLVDGAVRQTVDAGTRSAVVEGLAVGSTHRVAVRAVAGGARSTDVGQRLVLTYGPRTPRLAANPTNPLAGREWGTYLGHGEPAYDPWVAATGSTKEAIGRIALQPKARWFGRWLKDADAGQKVSEYIRDSAHGDGQVLSQLTLYRAQPWGAATHQRKPTAAEWASYQRYVNGVATGIGDRHMAIVLQPDGAWMQGSPTGTRSIYAMMAWTVRRLSALANTSVYLEIGSPDWLQDDPARGVALLKRIGIRTARGFALSTTHMDTTRESVKYGAKVVQLLAKQGILDKHFVVDTSDNGRGFTVKQYRTKYPTAPIGAAKICRTATQKLCVALGIPPTTDVANPRWGMPAEVNRLAAQYVDGYLWIDRPWLKDQIAPFMVRDAVSLADQNPYG